MINNVYQQYGIFTDNEPTLNDLIVALKQYKVTNILSLDRDSGNRVAKLISDHKLPLKQIIFHIDPGNPGGQCRTLFQNIQSYISQFPILIHCRAGKDRTGFAIASWLIKTGRYNPCNAIKAVTSQLGYGTGGISEIAKNTMDIILGCPPDKKEEEKKELTADEAAKQLNDTSSADDAVMQAREDFAHQNGSPYCGTIDSGKDADLVWRSVYTSPDQTYPQRDTYNYDDSFINVAYNSNYIIKRSNTRRKLIEKLIKFLKNDISKDDIPKQPEGINVGNIDNYAGFANLWNTPSGAMGAPNAAAPAIDSAGYIQI